MPVSTPSLTQKDRFSAAAASYDAYAHIQARVAGNLLDCLSASPLPESILEVGCGTGVFTEGLAARYPKARIVALDASAAMLERAREKLRGQNAIDWCVGDFRDWQSEERFCLVASSSALHWMEPIEESVQRMSDLVCTGGRIVAGVMLEGTLAELHACRRSVAPKNVPTGRLPTYEQVKKSFHRAGLQLLGCREERLIQRHASAEELLLSLHEQCLTGGSVSCGERALTRGELSRLAQAYEEVYATNSGGIIATYHIGYFLAERPVCS